MHTQYDKSWHVLCTKMEKKPRNVNAIFKLKELLGLIVINSLHEAETKELVMCSEILVMRWKDNNLKLNNGFLISKIQQSMWLNINWHESHLRYTGYIDHTLTHEAKGIVRIHYTIVSKRMSAISSTQLGLFRTMLPPGLNVNRT